ncbi:MAG: nucleotidyl transferase AbiEii/AbiGii toxin family protein [Gemmataceae bacterium]|nr:nucleotidyl transferase AbiEii/AbiGii toxin family protein [Gemmataceae bacterium]
MTKDIVEKDFWVCWTLKRVFSLAAPPAGLLFKGGTSLSKAFGAIRRFSEDVDLSFDRCGLGFGGADDPANAKSGKKATALLEDLQEECRRTIREELLPMLAGAMAEALGEEPGATWTLGLDAEDKDQESILFRYPQAPGGGTGYVASQVRLELGARSDHWPTHQARVVPYAGEDFPRLFKEAGCVMKVLAGKRTFWEKATILHQWHHAPEGKLFRDRLSRHYYDVAMLAGHAIGTEALADPGLLVEVAKHKKLFFPAAWARYDEAKPGTLRLVPPESRLATLEADYGKMREMLFGDVPGFAWIIERLRVVEEAVNAATGG